MLFRPLLRNMLLACACAAAALIPASDAMAQARQSLWPSTDWRDHAVMGVKLGMTRDQAAIALARKGLQLTGSYDEGTAEELGTQLQADGDCQTNSYRLREVTMGQSPRLFINLTRPSRLSRQRVWSIAFTNSFSQEADIQRLTQDIINRFGRPQYRSFSQNGTEYLFFYGDLKTLPGFDQASAATQTDKQSGILVSIKGPSRDARWGQLQIQIGDAAIWDAAQKRRDADTPPLSSPMLCPEPVPADQ